MADVDMKQKIKEVRDKFLSNNQIEDIRQNITLGVEERLKFLNTEQIKVVELLEEKHKELDSEIQLHAKKLHTDRTSLEALLNEKIASIEVQLSEQTAQLEEYSAKSFQENAKLETRFEETLKESLGSQATQLTATIAEIQDNVVKFKTKIDTNQAKIEEKIANNNLDLDASIDKNSTKIEKSLEITKEMLEENKKEILKIVDDKLAAFEKDKKEFLIVASNTFSDTLIKLEDKIKTFTENHQTVENIIDSRLTEFREAQKAAFEELEAALTLLEKHQDETINRFKNKSALGISRHINLPSSSKNRGSILHQPTDILDGDMTTVHSEMMDHSSEKKSISKINSSKILYLVIFLSLVTTSLVYYLNIDIESLLKLTRNVPE